MVNHPNRGSRSRKVRDQMVKSGEMIEAKPGETMRITRGIGEVVRKPRHHDLGAAIEETCEQTMAALGAALVAHFPECETGDEPISQTLALRTVLREYVRAWVRMNK